MQSPASSSLPLLLTGATGTVGTQLVRILLSRHVRIRILAREPEKVRSLIAPSLGIPNSLQASTMLPKSELIEMIEYAL